MTGQSFDQYFEKDFVSGDQWWQDYGERVQEFTIAKFGFRPSWDKNLKPQPGYKDKPVVYLAELGEKVVFLNQTNFKTLRELLGPGYETNPKCRGVVLKMTCRETVRKNDRIRTIEIIGLGEKKNTPDVSEEIARKFLEFLGRRDLGLSDFYWWLRTHNKQGELADDLAEIPLEEWPKEGQAWIKRFCAVAADEPNAVRRP